MSRTTRHIPFWVKTHKLSKDWSNTHVMLGSYFFHPYFDDPRNAVENGRDSGKRRNSLHGNYPAKGWPECGDKYYKKRFSKSRRRKHKQHDWLSEY